MKISKAITAFSFAASLAAAPSAQAQSSLAGKPIQLLVGFSAGGTSDIVARVIAEKIGPQLGANVIVQNKPGANGNIAAGDVARSAPDGLTLYLGSFNNPVNQAAQRKLPFDFMRDFAPVAMVAYAPNVLIVNKDLPVRNVRDLIALAKREPGKLSFGSAGAGSSLHMAGELFNNMAHVEMVHVPYKGSAPAMTDVIGGHIDMMFDNLPTAMAQIKGGSVRALAVTGRQRVDSLPDVPTVDEAGIPGFDVTSFFALYAPTGTPPSVIAEINAATNKALAVPDLQRKFAEQGAVAGPGTPQQLRALTESEVKKWRVVIQAANIKLD
jgi:tripartite-type tricarboxylate transporter receptor subunit TctC